MCSPQVMSLVREEMSRRTMLGMATAATVAGLSAVRVAQAQDATPVAPAASPVSLAGFGPFSQIQELSHVHGPDFPMFPGAQQMEIDVIVTIAEDGFFKNQLTLDEHTGTHMDAPRHFVEDGTSAENLPVEQLIAPLCVIDISDRAATDPDSQLMVDDILAWEAENGELPAGAFVAMYSGWESRVNDATAYINQDDADVPHFPGFHPDAATLLVNERDIVGIGVDTVSLDYGASTDFGTHLTVLPAGKFGLENLANLSTVPPFGATIIAGGPKHINASGGPTRALALF
jgi:kynurenine formamidase